MYENFELFKFLTGVGMVSIIQLKIGGRKKCFKHLVNINPLTTSVSHDIETSQLISNTDQLTGFYMMGSIGR